MNAQQTPIPGVLLAIIPLNGFTAVEQVLLYYPMHTLGNTQELVIAWNFYADDQKWHPKEIGTLEDAVKIFPDLFHIDIQQIRSLW